MSSMCSPVAEVLVTVLAVDYVAPVKSSTLQNNLACCTFDVLVAASNLYFCSVTTINTYT